MNRLLHECAAVFGLGGSVQAEALKQERSYTGSSAEAGVVEAECCGGCGWEQGLEQASLCGALASSPFTVTETALPCSLPAEPGSDSDGVENRTLGDKTSGVGK